MCWMEGTPEQQVQQLKEEYERRLAKIKSQTPEFPEPQAEAERILGEHQAVSETAENMIKEQVPEFEASSHESGHSLDELSEEAHTKIQEWVSIAGENPYKSVEAAKGSGDPSLFDPLHGALTSDKNFIAMVKSGKLPQLTA